MNRLNRTERAQIIRCLVEGNSIRSTVRMTEFAKNTVTKLLVDLGKACAIYQDDALRDLTSTRIECDEIWSFCHAKARNVPADHAGEFGYGDVWTWVALDPDSKLVATWLVGQRDGADAMAFLLDLAPRLANRPVQITTDGHKPYIPAVAEAFGGAADYAMLVKVYGTDFGAPRFSPPVVLSEDVRLIQGNPDPDKISTSYVERQNLTMRMGMRRFTRLTNALLQEGREPCRRRRHALHALQLRAGAQDPRQPVPANPGHGGWHCRSRLDVRGNRGVARLT